MITTNAITTMNRLLQSLVGLTALALVGCKHTPIDYPVEDYDKLFPFRGVERPDGRYEGAGSRLGVAREDRHIFIATVWTLYPTGWEELIIVLRGIVHWGVLAPYETFSEPSPSPRGGRDWHHRRAL